VKRKIRDDVQLTEIDREHERFVDTSFPTLSSEPPREGWPLALPVDVFIQQKGGRWRRGGVNVFVNAPHEPNDLRFHYVGKRSKP
jgi:hypothetical protein